MIYIEYITRRAGVSREAFHAVAGRGQAGWAKGYAEDQLILNLGRTWRVGPEPEYVSVWYNENKGLERLGEWEAIFASGEAASFEDAFFLVARIDRAGCYEPLLPPIAGGGGPYYAEFFDIPHGTTREEVRAFFDGRKQSRGGLTLNLVADRIGGLGPEPRGVAFWSLPSYAALATVAHDLTDVASPVRISQAAVYADLGHEIL